MSVMLELAALQERFGPEIAESTFRDNRRFVVPENKAYPVLEFLKRERGFDMLAEMTAVDYLEYAGATDRFGVVYVLVNTTTGERVIVKTSVNPPEPELPRPPASERRPSPWFQPKPLVPGSEASWIPRRLGCFRRR